MKRVKRIAEMEGKMDRVRGAVDELAKALDDLDSVADDYMDFVGYYGSEDWFDDFEEKGAGNLPDDLKCGVLSEDLPYDLIVDMNDQAIRMLELATYILKEGR